MPDPTSLENDLRAIQALNQRHIEAALSSDIETVMSLWSDDFTVIPPVGPIVRGGRANAEIVQKGREQIHGARIGERVVRVPVGILCLLAASCCASSSVIRMGRGRCIVRSSPAIHPRASSIRRAGRY